MVDHLYLSKRISLLTALNQNRDLAILRCASKIIRLTSHAWPSRGEEWFCLRYLHIKYQKVKNGPLNFILWCVTMHQLEFWELLWLLKMCLSAPPKQKSLDQTVLFKLDSTDLTVATKVSHNLGMACRETCIQNNVSTIAVSMTCYT